MHMLETVLLAGVGALLMLKLAALAGAALWTISALSRQAGARLPARVPVTVRSRRQVNRLSRH